MCFQFLRDANIFRFFSLYYGTNKFPYVMEPTVVLIIHKTAINSIIATSCIINGEEIFLAFLKRSLGGKIPSARFELLCQFGK